MKEELVQFIEKVITDKEAGKIEFEEAGGLLCNKFLNDKSISLPESQHLADMVCNLAIPRESRASYGVGEWDEQTATKIKEKEWRQFTIYFEETKNK